MNTQTIYNHATTIKLSFLLFIIFISGLLQWEVFSLSWEVLSIFKIVHIVTSIALLGFIIVPFIHSHVYYYMIKRNIHSINGWILGLWMLLLTLSGIYLFFIGNAGGDIYGKVSHTFHLYGSFLLVILFLGHVLKKTPLVLLLLCLFYYEPSAIAQSKFIDFKLENNKTSYHIQDWTNSTRCKSCHEKIFNQWANSNHKNMVDSNPYYMVMETLAGEVEGEEFRKWCMSCHNPSGITTGLEKSSHPMKDNALVNTFFDKNATQLQEDFKQHGNNKLEEGVSCLMCHRISDASAKGNASYKLNLTQQKKYPLEQGDSSTSIFISDKFINSNPLIHKQSYMKPLYKQSKYCASCHDETSPITGEKLVSTYDEWEASPYNNPKDKSQHKTCIDCHMTQLNNNQLSPLKGFSTTNGIEKKDVKVHYFAGSNHFLAGLKDKTTENQIIQLLKTSAKLDMSIGKNKLLVGVTNSGAGHHLPTGVSDFRQLWLEITVKNKEGKTVFKSGYANKEGIIDTKSRFFMKVFGDENKKPVGLLFWKYKTLLKDTRIKAKERREEQYDLPTFDLSQYPLNIQVKLNFRIYPQWVTNLVQKTYPALPNPPIITLNEITKEIAFK